MKELTAKQEEAINYVSLGLETKDIALKLGVSPATIDQRVEGARRKLGGRNRKEAARLYIASKNMSQRPIYAPLDVAESIALTASSSAPRDKLRFEDAIFDDRALWDRNGLWRRPHIAPKDLGKASRLLVILAMAVFLLLIAGEGVQFAKTLGLLFQS